MRGPALTAAVDELREYEPGDAFDEAFAATGVLRAHYVEAIESLMACDLAELSREIVRGVDAIGMRFRVDRRDQPFPVDPVPRVIERGEWRMLERGLAQRARALNAFLDDAYGSRKIVEAGRMPARVLDGADMFEGDMCDVPRLGGVPAGVAGFDVVRDADGRFEVLEDNLRTPSGMAYLAGMREVLDGTLPVRPPGRRAHLKPTPALGDTLRAAAPDAFDDPHVVLLSDGAENSAWWEHVWLGRALGIPVATPRDVELRAGRVWARDHTSTARPVDVVYRRTDVDRLRGPDGELTWLGELLLEPLRNGAVACVNSFGNGLADDKLVHAYVEEMIRFYLGEDPVVSSVPTYDPADASVRGQLLARIDELVVKPRTGSGGAGIVICPHASRDDVEQAARRVRARPEAFVLQEMVSLSTHPTAIDGLLEPRHVDLRPFVMSTPETATVLAGGLTRVALDRGALVVNSSMNGGGKDTWMLT